jgi:hypothetical protein
MSRAIYPIIDILKGEKQRFPLSFAEVFEAEDASREDEFTYTARFKVSDEGPARDRIRARLRAQDPEEAERLIALLDENDWSVSVLVDNY